MSISFGNRFFSPFEILEISEDHILKVKLAEPDVNKEDYRLKVLNYCVENPNVKVNYALTQKDLISIAFRRSTIEKKSDLEFWFH